ncbi:MAG TPA: hypothetical protein VJ925_05200 [Longimicrobiales bacterium]|nr:hypothetical protein [Longimicrobiales bacterium]
MATTRFRVLDAMPAPHGGHILQLRLQEGDAPALRVLRSAKLTASGPDGQRAEAEVSGFALFGGKPSAERFERTGRIDLHVTGDRADAIAARWDVEIA